MPPLPLASGFGGTAIGLHGSCWTVGTRRDGISVGQRWWPSNWVYAASSLPGFVMPISSCGETIRALWGRSMPGCRKTQSKMPSFSALFSFSKNTLCGSSLFGSLPRTISQMLRLAVYSIRPLNTLLTVLASLFTYVNVLPCTNDLHLQFPFHTSIL